MRGERNPGRLAERQHSVIARWQLRQLGLSDDQVDRRIARGSLRPVHRGVYLVAGARSTREGVWMAATLALGQRAALSHTSAAQLWGLLPGCSSPVHVTIPTQARKRPGLVVHRSRPEVARRRGIPVTKPARTLADLAGTLERRRLERAVDEALRLRLTTEVELCRAPALRRLLAEHAAGTTATENDFEELLIGICDDLGIPRPVCQARVGRYRPDFAWPDRRLIVEADSWESHGTRKAFEGDRRKDAELHALGWVVLRFTHRQMTRDREWVARMLHR
jgi:very-short-patch-repair endonuclease